MPLISEDAVVRGSSSDNMWSVRRLPLRGRSCLIFLLFVSICVSFAYFLYSRDVLTVSAECPAEEKCFAVATSIFGSWRDWQKIFELHKELSSNPSCKYTDCSFISDRSKAHALLFHGKDLGYGSSWINERRANPNQKWVFLSWESPMAVNIKDDTWRYMFNWTATYKRSSTIWATYGETNRKRPHEAGPPPLHQEQKRYLAMALVSNCKAKSRLRRLQELQEHADLTIFGRCGSSFEYPDLKAAAKDFYFFMAYENAQCQGYITEKLWRNALEVGMIPVVFGARRVDYQMLAPPQSFIFAEDFSSPASLAQYLKDVVSSNEKYMHFFQWRYTHSVNTMHMTKNFACQLCTLLHEREKETSIIDLHKEWNTSDCRNKAITCTDTELKLISGCFLYVSLVIYLSSID